MRDCNCYQGRRPCDCGKGEWRPNPTQWTLLGVVFIIVVVMIFTQG